MIKLNSDNINLKYLIGNVIVVILAVIWAVYLMNRVDTVWLKFGIILDTIFQASLCFIGLRYFFVKPEQLKIKKLLCTEPVDAVLLTYKSAGILGDIIAPNTEINFFKNAVYVFEWDGCEIKAAADLPYVGKDRRGVHSEILVNPKNPGDIYEPEIELKRINHYRFFGTMLILMGLDCCSLFFGD